MNTPHPLRSRNTSWSGTRTSFPAPLRRAILTRDPTCRACGLRPSTVADHIVPVAECALRGITDPHTADNGQGLCTPCHDLKTRGEIRRGIARTSTRRPTERHPGLR